MYSENLFPYPKTARYSQQVSKGYDHIHEVYSMFVGQPHFAAIIDLLGYQGVSLIIEGLLENVRNKVSTQC